MSRLGAEALLTPGEIVRDFVSVLNILQQNPKMTLNQLIQSSNFQPTKSQPAPQAEEGSEYAEFTV